MSGPKLGLLRLLSAGLIIGLSGCTGSSDGDDPASTGGPPIPTGAALASLVKATTCDDLLTKIQDDAVAKVKMAAALAQARREASSKDESGGLDFGGGNSDAREESATAGDGSADDDSDTSADSAPTVQSPGARTSAKKPAASNAPTPATGAAEPADALSADEGESSSDAKEDVDLGSVPRGASDTNRQVQEIDEADFVKVVNNGAGMFLLHGDTLRKLKTFPPAQTMLTGMPLKIEGTPSEMFVTGEGRAVVFSSVYGYPSASSQQYAGDEEDVACSSDGRCYSGGGALKITIADLSADSPKLERELYYEGSYVSSRRYDAATSDVVRVVVRSNSNYYGLYQPDIEWNDPWGRAYDQANITAQLAEWERRTSAAIRATTLKDWLPSAYEAKDGKRVELARQCESYYVPVPGLSEHGLTQVLALDVTQPAAPVGGVTIVGATSTVYSNAARLVLAQPDYRWNDSFGDFGIIDEERTALHVFDLAAANTAYLASGWVPGHLPPHNPQFGIDIAADGTVRVATTGQVRDHPAAKPSEPGFYEQHPETHVITARANGATLEVVGKSVDLGLPGERVQSARFIGDRAYVVTFLQTDPLVVVDVANAAAPSVLGAIKIPGFSQYLHPLDDNHLITVGQSANRGIQLQLFDVTDPMNIPAPKLLDFGSGSHSEASYQHKAFTLYNGVLAVPVSGSYVSPDAETKRGYYASALQLVKVDVSSGLQLLGSIDHARLYADNGAGVRCGVCDPTGCYRYTCGYAPEVRRGHFVSGENNATYVYSFSHAGVLVHDLANLTQPLASVGLPQPEYANGAWYGTGAVTSGERPARTPRARPIDSAGTDEDPADNPPEATPPTVRLDAGSTPTLLDAGAAVAPDAGVSADGG